MKKKLFISMMIICMGILIFGAVSCYALSEVYEISNGEATITGYDGICPTNYTVPSAMGGYPVTAIGDGAYYNAKFVNVVIPDTVKRIGSSAFNASKLKTVSLPDSVTQIAESAFKGTPLYDNTDNWSKGVLYIGNHLISVKTTKSGSFAIKEGVVHIAEKAFLYCEQITSITIPDSVKTIEAYAFRYCKSLTSINIPNGVTSLPDSVFEGCTALSDVKLGGNISRIGSNTFATCAITEIQIPDSVTSIGDSAFINCTSLTKVKIGSGVKALPNNIFRGCSALTEISIPNGVTSIGTNGFYGCSSLETIHLPGSLKTISNELFYDCTKLTSVTIPQGVTLIGKSAFLRCSSLREIEIPGSVNTIYNDAFKWSGLTQVTINGAITNITSGVFQGCSALKTVIFAEGTKSITNNMFSGCKSLENIILPSDLSSIGEYAFDSCVALKGISIPESVTSIGQYAFNKCSLLNSVIIPEGITNISQYTFSNCSAMTEVTIPKSVVEIGTHAFYKCDNLQNVYYSGREEDWEKVTINSYNSDLENATRFNGVWCTFLNDDGTVYAYEFFYEGNEIILPENPVKEPTAQYSYTFDSWQGYEDGMVATTDMTFYAKYTESINKYTVRFADDEGNVILENTVDYGTVLLETPEAPAKESTAQYSYIFDCWDGFELGTTITEDVTFTAKYIQALKRYTYKFTDDDGRVILEKTEDYGTVIELPEIPVKQTTPQYTYIFSAWENYMTDMILTGDITFIAQYETVVNQYTYKFINEGETVFEKTADYGTLIEVPQNPQKSATAQYTYTFNEWYGYESGMTITEDISFVAVYDEKVNTYTYKFVDEDGTVVAEKNVEYGTVIELPQGNFIKPSTAQYTFTFVGWNGYTDGMRVTEDVTFNIVYTATVNQYTYKFVDSDGNVVLEKTADYGTVIKAPEGPSKAPTKQYTFSFSQWLGYTPDMILTGNVTFEPSYTSVVNQYTYKFINEGKTVFEKTADYGTLIEVPQNPQKSATAQYTYIFNEWYGYESGMTITEDISFVAVYDEKVNTYTYKFVDEDGTVVAEKNVEYGTVIELPQGNFIKPSTAQYTFTFVGWNGYTDGMRVTEDVTFNIVYTATVNQYTYKFVDSDGNVVLEKTADYGTVIKAPEGPSKAPTKQYTFSFAQWLGYTPDMILTGNVTFEPSYTSVVNQYTYKFMNEGIVHYENTADYGTAIALPENPTKSATAQYTYTFSHWNNYNEGMSVSDNIVFDAIYTATVNRYTYKFVDEDGNVVLENTVDYGTVISDAPEVPYDEYADSGEWQGYTDGFEVVGDVVFTLTYKYTEYVLEVDGTDIVVPIKCGERFYIEPVEKGKGEVYGYDFVGYFDGPDGSGNKLTNQYGYSYTVYNNHSDMTVYPYFIPNRIPQLKKGQIMLGGKTEAFIGDAEDTVVNFVFMPDDSEYDISYFDVTIRFDESLELKNVVEKDSFCWYLQELSRTTSDGYTDVTFRIGSVPWITRGGNAFDMQFAAKESLKEGSYTISIIDCVIYEYNTQAVLPCNFEEVYSHTVYYRYPTEVESVEIIGADVVNDDAVYTAKILPEDVPDTAVIWSVDDESVATIDRNGVLIPLKSGNVVVTARSNLNTNVWATKKVEVKLLGLNSVATDIGVWNKPFYIRDTEYKIYVDANAEIFTAIFSLSSENLTLRVGGSEAVKSGEEFSISLNQEETTLTCECLLEDGTVYKTYTLTVVKFSGIYAWVSDNKSIVNVVAGGAPKGTVIIAAYYNNDRMVGWSKKAYDKKRITFDINVPYDKVKLFAWKKLDVATPVLPSATFEFK